ncbi:MAG: phosphate ABC transporter substrate-binding protein [Candidatus Omnitrophica bacterium]|nr:phosphate ABC transporter substrate-binding protein [Candidatus Omnitrophota bacterium]MDD5351564.1 phosphate ABC transporter substrate-binding protein [Candidatus Omnitrophota bacterium]MDD5550999.1 phosphate ABC transporter substrate-binding protein [Candidatus Omnitrophota bacterium]
MKVLSKALILAVVILGLEIPCYAEKIVVEGSTTVLPIAQKAAEVFMNSNPGADISVRGGGSGVGIASLIDKNCNIADASRAMKDTEYEKAAGNGVDAKANVIAMDGICVIVNPSNNIRAMTKKQIKDIFTGKISNWKDVGGSDEKIVVISRDSSSGTFEAFGELVLKGEKVRPDALLQASNQAVASTVSRTPGAIGYVGLGYVSSSVKAVDVDGVKASKETVLTGTYSIGRPLFMYTNGVPKGLAKQFIDYILSPEGQKLVEEEGFVGLR